VQDLEIASMEWKIGQEVWVVSNFKEKKQHYTKINKIE
jgi:hypothetical protein